MEKQIKLVTIMMVVFFCFISMSSCKKDDSNDISIVGTWLSDDDEFIWRFHDDGTGSGEEFVYRDGKQMVKDTWMIAYVYDSERGTLVISDLPTDDGKREAEYIYDVVVLTSNKLILREEGDDDTESFTRQ